MKTSEKKKTSEVLTQTVILLFQLFFLVKSLDERQKEKKTFVWFDHLPILVIYFLCFKFYRQLVIFISKFTISVILINHFTLLSLLEKQLDEKMFGLLYI